MNTLRIILATFSPRLRPRSFFCVSAVRLAPALNSLPLAVSNKARTALSRRTSARASSTSSSMASLSAFKEFGWFKVMTATSPSLA
ncbi:hypothetical protein D9M70_635080 [compost metagenome]